MSERQRGANAGERRAGDDVAGGVMLMVAVTLVVSVVLVVGAMSFLPETDDPATRPDADFSIERDDGDIVVVFADNVGSVSDWRTEPSESERAEMADSFELDRGTVRVTASGVEPTDDIYMVFEPGCSESRFKFLRMQGSYNNQILLDGSELFRTDDATRGQVYTGPGLDCT